MNDELARKYQKSQRLLRQALEKVEWVFEQYGEIAWCPWCENYEHEGHKKDCVRQIALGVANEN